MNKKRKLLKSDYVMFALVAVIAILTIIRICSNTTKNGMYGITGIADGGVLMADSRYLELKLDAPVAGITGFSFQFDGDREKFGNASFLVTADIENDILNPQRLYQGELPLIEQAYDYQNGFFRVIIPFHGEIKEGDHLRIAIMGVGMSEKDNILIRTCSKYQMSGAVFEVNDFVQESMLTGYLYYPTKGRQVLSVLMQGIVAALLVLLAGEKCKESKALKASKVSDDSPVKKAKKFVIGKWFPLLPFLVLLLLFLEYTYYAGVKTQIRDLAPREGERVYAADEVVYRELCDGEAIFSEWRSEGEHLAGLGIYLREPYDEGGIFTIEVSELESQDLITSVEKGIYEAAPGEEGLLEFNFDAPIKKSGDKEYLVAIYYSGEPVEIRMINDGGDNPVFVSLYRQNDFLNVLFILFSFLIIGFSFAFFLCMQNKVKVEKLLLAAVILLGILFETVITPFAVPDEAAHIDTAYRISNQMLGVEDTGIRDAIYKRECDIRTDSGVRRTLDVESYRWLYEDWFSTEGRKTERLIFAADARANANSLFYLPIATGITVGRILGMGFLPMIFLSRILNLLLSAWIIYLAVKKIPFGKSILCAIALLPITVQEISACTYDALIIAVSILYVSYCIFAIYSKRRLKRTEILVIFITALLLGMCKGGVYTPLHLLGIWALIKKGYIGFPQKKAGKIAMGAALAGIVLIFAGGVIFLCREPVDPHSLRGGFYTVGYLVQHPMETVRILENTLYQKSYGYLEQCIGKDLGSWQVSARFVTPIGYMLLMGAAVICDGRRPYIARVQEKGVFILSAVLASGAVLVAMLTATPYGDKAVDGVQGRYFIPVLWLLLISFRKGKIVHKKKRYREIVMAGFILGICTVIQLVINVLNPM